MQHHVLKLCLLISVVALPAASHAQGNVGCVSPTNSYAPLYRYGYGGMVSRTDQASASNRTLLGLPTIANAQVTIVSDTTTCRIASAAYDSAVSFQAPNQAPLVLKIGTAQYVVVKGLDNQGARINVLFNQTFTVAQKQIWY